MCLVKAGDKPTCKLMIVLQLLYPLWFNSTVSCFSLKANISMQGLESTVTGACKITKCFWCTFVFIKGLGFDSQCWPCVEVSGKLLIPYCLCPPSSNGYLVERKIGKLWLTLAAENALNSPQRRWDCIRESSNTRGVNCKVCWTHGGIRL